ncbi:ketosteroid isomerase-like protein [Frankia torreyi]|uniref:Ketosteroid isomerase-like protein n=1 Tax=Frankia torreyi TaxID=1856 RepID=A0A0D8BM99_9ACTN|nr:MULTISPECIES: nuclear transport factor 2 family protein [Frankia]KJE24572.1 ketosteroid isomerase-like protein [Frankia torreyi]KQC37611.1 limonene-1,2-epoxide hydrolase [Frankia sp. ACN1ag]KQM07723.1 ketosteroid isomerase-like protein [Frankia sp. CpI1-P]
MGEALDTVKRALDAFDAGDEAAVHALLDDDLVVEAPGGVRICGRDAAAGYSAAFLAAFGDADVDTHILAEQGELVVEEYTLTATHTGILRDADGTEHPPTGRRVTLRVVEVYRVQHGLITENRLYFDQTLLARQLDAADQPPR